MRPGRAIAPPSDTVLSCAVPHSAPAAGRTDGLLLNRFTLVASDSIEPERLARTQNAHLDFQRELGRVVAEGLRRIDEERYRAARPSGA